MNIYHKLAQKTGITQVLVLWGISNSGGNLQLVFYKLFMEVDSTGYIACSLSLVPSPKGRGTVNPVPIFFESKVLNSQI